MPEISVIVPVYKAEKYLNRCVDSVLAQTFRDFELILVDDGSPDCSGRICDHYAQMDSRVRVIHQKNGGVSSARNAGLDVVKGNWVTFIDSDDYVTETYLQDLYEPEYDLCVVSHMHIQCANGSRTVKSVQNDRTKNLDGKYLWEILDRSGTYWVMFCWGRLYRNSLLKEHNLTYEYGMDCGEDFLFSAQYLSLCRSLVMKDLPSYIHVARERGTLSTTFDIAFFQNIEKAEDAVSEIIKKRFGFDYPRKSMEEKRFIYAGCLGGIISDSGMSFYEKYRTLKYLYRIAIFRDTLENPEKYYLGSSSLYQWLIRTKSPLLMLTAVRMRMCLLRK